MRLEHDWITVGRRRWCVRCDAYQQGVFTTQIADCEDTTPYAKKHPRPDLPKDTP